jgi:hypothetical protein
VRELARQREERQEREKENRRQRGAQTGQAATPGQGGRGTEKGKGDSTEDGRREEKEGTAGGAQKETIQRSQGSTRRIGTLLIRFGRGSAPRARGHTNSLPRQNPLGTPSTTAPPTTPQEACKASPERTLTRGRRGARVLPGTAMDGCTGKTRVEPNAPESGALPPRG